MERTVGELAQELSRYPFLASLTLIGRPLAKRDAAHVMDLDLITVVGGDMTPEKYQAIRKAYENALNFGHGPIDVQFALKDGPMKPMTEEASCIFLHGILHTEKSYRESPLVLVENSWQYAEPIAGKSPMQLRKIKRVTPNLLLDGALGINHCAHLVQTNSSAYLKWVEQDGVYRNKLNPMVFTTPEAKLELYCYAALRCASNFVKMRYGNQGKDIGIGGEMARLFGTTFPDTRWNKYPTGVLEEKTALRQGVLLPTEAYVLNKQVRTLDFLGALKRYVESEVMGK